MRGGQDRLPALGPGAVPPRDGRFVFHLPEPANLWIRACPRAGRGWRGWPGPRRPWSDLSRGGRPVWGRSSGRSPEAGWLDAETVEGDRLDDVLYLPPVAAAWEERRREIARRQTSGGAPVLIQSIAGAEPAPNSVPVEAATREPGIVPVFDLLGPLLEGDLAVLETLPAGAAAVWPLVAGRTDDPELWRQGCARLAAAGVEAVQALSPPLGPDDRRQLAEGCDEVVFDALFHRPAPEPRAFAREARRHGLEPFLDRPLPRPPLRGSENRRVAGLLALAAELWHRLGRPAARGQELFRAAREIDRAGWDLVALARDGNLGVLDWLTERDRAMVEEALAGRRPALLEEMWQEYLAET